MARFVFLLFVASLLVLPGCARNKKVDEMQEQLDAYEVKLAEIEENQMEMQADYATHKSAITQGFAWLYNTVNQMLPYMHYHEAEEEDSPQEAPQPQKK